MRFASIFAYLITLYISFASAGFIPLLFADPPTTKRPIPGGSPLLLCDVIEEHLLDISTLVLSPSPPKRGATLSIVASGLVLKDIEEGAYVNVDVRLGYIKLLTQTFDLCEIFSENDIDGLTCPIAAGQYNLKKDVEIPKEVPPGKYIIVARAYSVDGELITCITGEIIFPVFF